MIRTRWKRCFQILYFILSINLFFFLLIYHRLIIVKSRSVRLSLTTNLYVNTELTIPSSLCPIPQFDPWDQTVAKSIRIKPIYRCPTLKKNLVDVINFTRLIVNQKINRTFYSGSISHCIYLKVGRNPEEKFFRDWSYTLSEPVLMTHNPTESIIDADFVLTRCFRNRTDFFHGDQFCGYRCLKNITNETIAVLHNRSLVYEYVHPLMHLKKSSFSSDRSPPSVFMIILDAVSDLQSQRALPRTLSYLKSLGLLTFHRHAVVGDGTFANLAPMLFGQSVENLQTVNLNDSHYEFWMTETEIDPTTKKKIKISKRVHYPGPYDNSSFILTNFSRLNYTTYFSEEWRESALYNLKNGFRQSPTDFYLRPYWLALYDTLSYPSFSGNSNPKPCYLNKLLHFLSLNWLEQFFSLHHPSPSHPTVGVMKLNEMSHDYLERLFWIDEDLRLFFQNLFEKRLLDNTIVIFCGDHGHRQHRLRLTRIGSFEVKLPFFSLLLPPKWKNTLPQVLDNLHHNQNVLTSWWDVYETLVNLFKMVEEGNQSNPLNVKWKPTTPGISLFHRIPDRNCSSAGIPDKFCPCSRSRAIDFNSTLINDLAKASIKYINEVKLRNHSHLCHSLVLKEIIRAEVEDLITNNFTHSYTVLFEVFPSNGIFESRLFYDERRKTTEIHPEILRINLYGETSKCIQDQYDLRSFCYCFSYSTTPRTSSTTTTMTTTVTKKKKKP